jgi:3',5'-nucleoside bisphosphate phosphatase
VSEPRFDLQSHSTHSDGHLPPEDVVALAARAGVELLALSDHDTVDGVDDALRAGAEHGVAVIPTTEISAVDGGYEDLHVLGYGIDHHDPVLLERLRDARADRERRAERMGNKLRELGYEIDPAPLEARKTAGKPVGRPHLTQAVLQHPANRERLEREGLNEVSKFLPEYLIPGKPAYLPRTRPTVPEAIRWIHDAGGVAVWAHPFWDVEEPDEVLASIDRFREAGLDGVEVFYPVHDAERTKVLSERCAQLGLLATGSSDFHGPDHKLFSQFLAYEFHGRDPELGPIAEVAGPEPARDGAGLCLWLTGLSGAGKSTVGHLVASRLREHGHKVELLDGDVVRRNLCADLGYTRDDRDANIRRIAFVADLLSRNGVIAIVAAISPYRETRDEARALMNSRFLEVWVRASVDECARRDVKGLYEKARHGEIALFTGVSDPYEEPLEADLVLDTERDVPQQSAARVVALVEERLGALVRS